MKELLYLFLRQDAQPDYEPVTSVKIALDENVLLPILNYLLINLPCESRCGFLFSIQKRYLKAYTESTHYDLLTSIH